MADPRRPLFAAVREYVVAEGYRGLPPDDLWAKVRDGPDEHAFRVVLERLGPRVFARCRAVVRDEHRAEEAFQDAFRLLVRNRAKLPTYAAAAAWVYQTATYTARRHRRTWWRRTRREVPLTGGGPAVTRPSPLEAADAVGVALAGLPDKYRRPLELVYWDGLTHAEAANVLGVPTATVSTRVSRGLARLRERLGVTAPAVGAAAGVEGLLVAPAPALTAVRLEAAAAVWRSAVLPGGWVGWLPGWRWAGVGLAAVGTAVAVGGLAGPGRAPEPPALEQVRPPAVAREPLATKNLQLLRTSLLPRMLAEMQQLLPPELMRMRVAEDGVRAWGSEVEVEFVGDRAMFGKSKPPGIRIRYCVFRRRMEIISTINPREDWTAVRGTAVMTVDVPIPGFGTRGFVVGADRFEAVGRILAELPPDDRAEREHLDGLFGPPGGDLILSARSIRSMCGVGPDLFVVTDLGPHGDGWVYALRGLTGRREYLGNCPAGWLLTADSRRLYAAGGKQSIIARAKDRPDDDWVPLCEQPGAEGLAAISVHGPAADRLVVITWPDHGVYTRPLSDRAAAWERIGVAPPAVHYVAAGDRLVALTAEGAIRVGSASDPARPWQLAGQLPVPAAHHYMAVVGDRLLVRGPVGEPILARPLDAGPAAGWQVIGRVCQPAD